MKLIIKPETVRNLLIPLSSNAKMTSELFVPLTNVLSYTYQEYQSARQKLQSTADYLNRQQLEANDKLAKIRYEQAKIMQKIAEVGEPEAKVVLYNCYEELEVAADECANCINAIEKERQICSAKWQELMNYNSCFENGQSFLQELQGKGSTAAENILAIGKSIERLIDHLEKE